MGKKVERRVRLENRHIFDRSDFYRTPQKSLECEGMVARKARKLHIFKRGPYFVLLLPHTFQLLPPKDQDVGR